jgi:hypothetical protein
VSGRIWLSSDSEDLGGGVDNGREDNGEEEVEEVSTVEGLAGGWQWGSAGDGLIGACQGDPELRRWTSLPCRQSTCKLFGGCSCHRGGKSGL